MLEKILDYQEKRKQKKKEMNISETPTFDAWTYGIFGAVLRERKEGVDDLDER